MGNRKVFKKILRWIILFASVLAIVLLIREQRSRQHPTYYMPSYIPEGYVGAEPENDLISSESLGLGVVLRYEKENQALEITTYENFEDFSSFCTEEDIQRSEFHDIRSYTYNGYWICNYDYGDTHRNHYLVKDEQEIRIWQENHPFLEEAEIGEIIDSLELKEKE